MTFPLSVRGSLLSVDVTEDHATYSLSEGGPVTIKHFDETFTLAPGLSVTQPVPPLIEQ